MAGSRGMTDAQVAVAAARYRRRQFVISVGFYVGAAGQLCSFFAENGSGLALASGLGFTLCAALSLVAWRRGLPDTRRNSAPSADD